MKRVIAVSCQASLGLYTSSRLTSHSEGNKNDHIIHQPSFSARTSTTRVQRKGIPGVTLDSLVLITGSAHKELSQEISNLIKVPIADATLARFADGEVSLQINENIRGKDVVVIQPCAAPVNDSIMELLLTVSCARRAGARRIVAVIPYFGYKHHRRGSAISTKHHSRFLSSGAMDFAKMLQEMGVDRVIAVDLQRPGQGHEACFFDNGVPLETIVTTDMFVKYFINDGPKLQEPILVVTPNAECVKKARVFQRGLQKHFQSEVKVTTFFAADTGSGAPDATKLDLLANAKLNVEGGDVIIVDDMVDTAGTLHSLSTRLKDAGARNVYLCASHGLFTSRSMELIDNSPISGVIVANTLPLPKICSSKIVQVSVAPLLADVILTEHFRSVNFEVEEFEIDGDNN